MVSFGGYLLPVQYREGVIREHMAVRTRAGLFDVSHMGEILCEGKDALANLQMLLTNDFRNMTDGQARYSPMCNENGGTVDDLIVYRKAEEQYFIVVNAANKDKDYQWMKAHQSRGCGFYGCFRILCADCPAGTESSGDSEKSCPGTEHPGKNIITRCLMPGLSGFRVSSQRQAIPERMGMNCIWTVERPWNCGTRFWKREKKKA